MLFKFFLICVLTIISTLAEAPLARSGPYPAAGWRPDIPFNLPGEVELQREKPQNVNVEITKERVDFIGQVPDNNIAPISQPQLQNSYVPAKDNREKDFVKVQHLPDERRTQIFHQDKFFPKQQEQHQFGQRFQPKPQVKPNSQTQQIFPATQTPHQQQQFPRPAEQYGAPYNEQNINIIYPDPRSLDDGNNEDFTSEQDNRKAIESLNEAIEAYNRAQSNRNAAADVDYNSEQHADDGGYVYNNNDERERFVKGQYYVLGPDNKVQRVMFITSQDESEKRSNGFTAQLKYTPVGEVRDPVFKYNNKGQLVRLFKK